MSGAASKVARAASKIECWVAGGSRNMTTWDLFRVWGRVLQGRTPFLSLEITKECPLRCPGCYAYSPDHVAPLVSLRQLSDYRGSELVSAAVSLVRRLRPIHISIIGG